MNAIITRYILLKTHPVRPEISFPYIHTKPFFVTQFLSTFAIMMALKLSLAWSINH